MNDRLIVGSIAGGIGALVMVGFNILFNLIPGISVKFLTIAASLYLPSASLGTAQANIMGFIAHLICGGLMGVLFIYILDITGHRYYIVKGLGFGLVLFLLFCGVLTSLLDLPIQDKLIDNIFLLIIHIPFGLVLGYIIKKYYKIEGLRE